VSTKLQHHYGGWRRSGPNPTLELSEAVSAEVAIKLQVDPRAETNKLQNNQWALGACTANATSKAFRYDTILDGKDCGELSRFDIYWQEREREGTIGQGDTGAIGHDAYWAAVNVGYALEKDWPYTWPGMTENVECPNDIFDPSVEPITKPERTYKLSKPWAYVPQTETAIKRVLSNRQTISFGFVVYQSFESPEVASTGVVPIPKAGEEILGGHETWIVGYLEAHPNYALVQNSWGPAWGLDGYFLMPWKYLANATLTSDFATIERGVN
jgi:C1A family cysteine protease